MIKWINVIISLGEKLQQLDLYVHCIIARGIVSYENVWEQIQYISRREACALKLWILYTWWQMDLLNSLQRILMVLENKSPNQREKTKKSRSKRNSCRKIKMCLIYLKYSDVISDIKALKEETITGKDFEDQAISTLALLHYWLRYWSKNTATALPSRK